MIERRTLCDKKTSKGKFETQKTSTLNLVKLKANEQQEILDGHHFCETLVFYSLR
jgi:hypothetical protein